MEGESGTRVRQTSRAIDGLVDYAASVGLIEDADRIWARNTVLEELGLDSYQPPSEGESLEGFPAVLDRLVDDAATRGMLDGTSVVERDLVDTAIMGRLTPPPRQVRERFEELREDSPKEATDWFYKFSQDTNYIRRDRSAKDIAWKSQTPYGTIDLTINLAKPEKDPRAIAAAKTLPSSGYPICLLCAENEGFAGTLAWPARQNHRTVPVEVAGAPWRLQYSPYVYYNEHCIVLNEEHVPMKVERATFEKLLDFVRQFPHYFVGSNADLPIVGGSILAHDHFQGGNYEFAMARAGIREEVSFADFPDVSAGIVDWPMSVLRLRGADPRQLADLADRVLSAWREYSDPEVQVYAHSGGEPHNTITPIARKRSGEYELDLVLRNNLTTEEHPLGLFHPHAELHHIKKENIGLIEVMGLAVLPARLEKELAAVAEGLLSGADLNDDPLTAPHANWAAGFADRVSADNVQEVIQEEVGAAFTQVLEHAGVFKDDVVGREAFRRFIASVDGNENSRGRSTP